MYVYINNLFIYNNYNMSKKNLLGDPELPSQYIIITNPDGGHTGQTAGYIYNLTLYI